MTIKKSKDPLGDRMKSYEMTESDRSFMPLLPIVARLDGHAFHAFTKGMDRPFDAALRLAMVATTEYLVRATAAKIGYTQSDEITLIWHNDDLKKQTWFNGRVLKTCTHLAAMASVFFNQYIREHMLEEYALRYPRFDARANNVPTMEEAVNNLLWRERDASTNSIKMLAQAYYSHSQLHGKSEREMHDMLHNKGVNWNSFPASFKRGVYVQSRKIATPAVLAVDLPPKHKGRNDPNLLVSRSSVTTIDMPIFSKVSNRVEVVFNGDVPRTQGRDCYVESKA